MSRYLDIVRDKKSEPKQDDAGDSSLNSLNSQQVSAQNPFAASSKVTPLEPIGWAGKIPIYVYPGEKCIRCSNHPAVGSLECPRWCQACYDLDKWFWKDYTHHKAVAVDKLILVDEPILEW